jgi:hypothetical protein
MPYSMSSAAEGETHRTPLDTGPAPLRIPLKSPVPGTGIDKTPWIPV